MTEINEMTTRRTFWLATFGEECMSIADAADPEFPLIYVSPGLLAATGYAAGDLIGRNWLSLTGPDTDPEAVRLIQEGIRDGRDIVVDLLNYRKNGESLWTRMTLQSVKGTAGPLSCVVTYTPLTPEMVTRPGTLV